jgi:hypothetical protein
LQSSVVAVSAVQPVGGLAVETVGEIAITPLVVVPATDTVSPAALIVTVTATGGVAPEVVTVTDA